MSLSGGDFLKLVDDAVGERMTAYQLAMSGKLKAETDALRASIADWDTRQNLGQAQAQVAADKAEVEQRRKAFDDDFDAKNAALAKREAAAAAQERAANDAAAKAKAAAAQVVDSQRAVDADKSAFAKDAQQQTAALQQRVADLDRREAAVSARETAIAEREQKVKSALAQIA